MTNLERIKRKKGAFIKGPIPLWWILRAAHLPGKSLHVGIALWALSGVAKSKTVSVTRLVRRDFGLERYTLYRALKHLEKDHLVFVDRRIGRAAVVTILEVTHENQ